MKGKELPTENTKTAKCTRQGGRRALYSYLRFDGGLVDEVNLVLHQHHRNAATLVLNLPARGGIKQRSGKGRREIDYGNAAISKTIATRNWLITVLH